MSPFESRLRRNYLIYTAGFIGFVSLLAVVNPSACRRESSGSVFLFATIAIYAGIG